MIPYSKVKYILQNTPKNDFKAVLSDYYTAMAVMATKPKIVLINGKLTYLWYFNETTAKRLGEVLI